MGGSAAGITIKGVGARVLRVVLGTVFLGVGLYLVSASLGAPGGEDALIGAGVGGLFALAGLYSYVQAVRTDTLRIVLGDNRDRHNL